MSNGSTPATDDEIIEIRTRFRRGEKRRDIAADMGRSYDFVWVLTKDRMHTATNHDDALRGRVYDDVDRRVVDREWPPTQLPLNGGAMARAASGSSYPCQ